VGLFEHFAGLGPVRRTPQAAPHTVTYRLVAAVLTSQFGSRRWHAAYNFEGTTWTGLPVPSWARRGDWILYREDVPVLALTPETGLAVTSDGAQHDVMALYAADRRIAPMMSSVLGQLIS
jgi:hypothetical protein